MVSTASAEPDVRNDAMAGSPVGVSPTWREPKPEPWCPYGDSAVDPDELKVLESYLKGEGDSVKGDNLPSDIEVPEWGNTVWNSDYKERYQRCKAQVWHSREQESKESSSDASWVAAEPCAAMPPKGGSPWRPPQKGFQGWT